jgi:SWI/SNF-related matrix-associated actin-dependent regulator of chromatin subfamily A3
LIGVFRPADQSKIRLALSLKRIDPADIPASARVSTSVRATSSLPSSSQRSRKRTVTQAGFESSSVNQNLSATQEQQDEEVVEEEVVDELYCQFASKVVGVQYYTGTSIFSLRDDLA